MQGNSGYIAPPFAVTVNPLTTNSASPSISGTCTNTAASLSVRVNGNWYGAANDNGAWTLPAGEIPALASGTYSVTVCGVNTAGQAAYATAVNDLAIATTSPTVAITAPASPTLTPVGSISINFSEAVEDFTLTDLQLTLANGGPAASEPLEGATLASSDNQHWTLGNLTGLNTAAGTYTLTLSNVDWGLSDAYGNLLMIGATTIWTRSGPAVVSIAPSGPTITNATSLQYTVTFNESVSNVLAADFTLSTSGTTGTIASISGSGASYTVTVNNVSGNGTLGLNLVSNDSIVDGNGNPVTGNFTGQVYTIDTTPPTVTIGTPSSSWTHGEPVSFTVTYADANFNASTLAAANISLNNTGTANGTVSVSGSGTTCTLTISGITGDGTLGISIAAGTASDLAGNLAPPAGPSGTFLVDNTGPTVTIAASATPNSAVGTTTDLFVQGTDIATGNGSLTYSWSATSLPPGAAAPVFNDINDSPQAPTATFSMAGTYILTATITDITGLSTTSSVSVTVNQTLTIITAGGQPLAATALDQSASRWPARRRSTQAPARSPVP